MQDIKQKIVPHLWYDTVAREAAEFHASIFPESRVMDVINFNDTPYGDCDVVFYELWGHRFLSINTGSSCTFNPSVSFMVNFDPLLFENSSEADARAKLDEVWEKLSDGGMALMPLDEYPFSMRYGWIQDRYGVSWQLILTNPDGEPRPPILPFLLFVGENCGRAEAAMNHYQALFEKGRQGNLMRHGAGQGPDKEGTIMFVDFALDEYWIAAMDSAHDHKFAFNEAISLIVQCNDQKEIDHFWGGLSAVPEAEQCGWLKDAYGLSWQVMPAEIYQMLQTGTKEQIARLVEALKGMKKCDLAVLRKAYEGR